MRWPSHLGVRSRDLGLIPKGKGVARVWLDPELQSVFQSDENTLLQYPPIIIDLKTGFP